jgi:predicted transcriptional regulator
MGTQSYVDLAICASPLSTFTLDEHCYLKKRTHLSHTYLFKMQVTKSTSDIFMSIKPEHMQNIASRSKNHEYRSYLLSSSIQHIWFYTSSPTKQIQYVARISPGKEPGEVPDDGGTGNADFNAGMKSSKYGYEILALWRLNTPVSLERAVAEGFLKGAPQKYCWVSVDFLVKYPLERQVLLFPKVVDENTVAEGQVDGHENGSDDDEW